MIIDEIEKIKSIIKMCESDLNGSFKGSQGIINKLKNYQDKLVELENSEEYKIYLDIKEKEKEKIKLTEKEKEAKKRFDLAEKNLELDEPKRHRANYSTEEILDIFENVERKDWDKMREYAEKYERKPSGIQFATDIIHRENEGEDCSFSGISSICRKALNIK